MHAWDCPCGTRNAPTFQQCRNCRRPAAQGRPVGVARPSAPPPPPRPAPPTAGQWPPYGTPQPPPPQQHYQPPVYQPPPPPNKPDSWSWSPRAQVIWGFV